MNMDAVLSADRWLPVYVGIEDADCEGRGYKVADSNGVRRDGAPVEVCDTVMAADRYVLSYRLPAD
jgi:hypothetical protein